MNEFIRGSKLFLRPVTADDASNEYLSWLNDPEINEKLATGNFPSTLDSLRSYLSNAAASSDIIMLAICDTATGVHIGNIKLDRFDWVSRTCELGIMIGDRSFWGKGYGEETCRLVLNYCFVTLNLRKVLLAVYENNPGAIKLYEKLGFVHEGRFRKHIYVRGTYLDKLFMGIFKEELTKGNP